MLHLHGKLHISIAKLMSDCVQNALGAELSLTMIYFFSPHRHQNLSSHTLNGTAAFDSLFFISTHSSSNCFSFGPDERLFLPIFRPPAKNEKQKCKLDKVVELFNLTHLIADMSLFFSLSRLYIGH